MVTKSELNLSKLDLLVMATQGSRAPMGYVNARTLLDRSPWPYEAPENAMLLAALQGDMNTAFALHLKATPHLELIFNAAPNEISRASIKGRGIWENATSVVAAHAIIAAVCRALIAERSPGLVYPF